MGALNRCRARPLAGDCYPSDPGPDPMRLVFVPEGSPYYSAPCSAGPSAGSVRFCELFEYLGRRWRSDGRHSPRAAGQEALLREGKLLRSAGAKNVSSCGEELCYSLIRVAGVGTYWIPDHALGHGNSSIGYRCHEECSGGCMGLVFHASACTQRHSNAVQGMKDLMSRSDARREPCTASAHA